MYGPHVAILLMCVSRNTRRVDFRGLTGSQWTPRVWGVTAWYQSQGKRLPWELGGCRVRYTIYLGLDGKRVRSCIHFALMNGVYNMLVICVMCLYAWWVA